MGEEVAVGWRETWREVGERRKRREDIQLRREREERIYIERERRERRKREEGGELWIEMQGCVLIIT